MHDLGVDLDDPDEQLARDGPVRPVSGVYVTRQGLAVHYFAPVAGPGAARAFARLGEIWRRCRILLGATVPTLDMPVDLPSGPPAMGTVAAARDPAATVRMLLRRDRDVLTLSILMCASASKRGVGWAGLDRDWDSVVAEVGDPMLGVARLYLGLAPPAASPFRALDQIASSAGLLLAEDDGWLNSGVMTAGRAMWELTPRLQVATERRFVVLAEAHNRAGLTAWVWSGSDRDAAPFTQYLLDAARVRYHGRVRQRAEAGLEAAYEGAADVEKLTVSIASLRDMATSVGLARDNMVARVSAADACGFVTDDRRVADRLVQQLEADQSYLESTRERVAVHNVRSALAATPAPTIGLVTALPVEFAAVRQTITDPEVRVIDGDYATYVLGTMPSADPDNPHQVALTLLGGTANPAAAAGVTGMFGGFASINQVVLVGVAAGIPAPKRPERHVRLGDIVVATWGIVAYDHIGDEVGGVRPRQAFPPPSALLTPKALLLAGEERAGLRPWEAELDRIIAALPDCARPPSSTDRLHASDDPHAERIRHPRAERSGHRPNRPKVHYAAIGSADRSVRSAASRDAIAGRWEISAIEMEGHGVGTAAFAAGRQYLVVRGISDYADSHLDHVWRPYASAAAAAYTAALLRRCPPLVAYGGHVLGNGGRLTA
ncbi:CATRA conflict system CASPASE/TPR repeat-associated protein [Phytohabitans sp. LJ34]|uniref:CATRA conflict system CASPASE/TPR repeat-associated protein n=1 Tax=Phytohabitans sp. LJ34 TaxID=3452217 RepID=UPI003F8C6A69